MPKIVRLGLGLGVALSVLMGATPALAASSTPSTSGAHIVAIYFDSPGADRGGNKSLDAEWVEIRNVTRTTKTLTHWTLRDRSHHVYTFPTFTLRAGAYAKIHTGSGKRTGANLYWGQHWYVWNNTGDTAYLRNAKGKSVDSCAYSKRSDPKARC